MKREKHGKAKERTESCEGVRIRDLRRDRSSLGSRGSDRGGAGGSSEGYGALRVIPRRKRGTEPAETPQVDRSRLNQLLKEKDELLEKLADCTKELAETYQFFGYPKEQLQEMRERCVCFELRYGPSHSRTMDMLHTVAQLHAEKGYFEEAAALLTKLYPIRLKVDGRYAEKTLKLYALRAVVFEELGEHHNAKSSLAELRTFGAQDMPELLSVTAEECESIYKEKRAAGKR